MQQKHLQYDRFLQHVGNTWNKHFKKYIFQMKTEVPHTKIKSVSLTLFS